MTNKEHIETIRILIGKCGTDEQVEAINAAIRALKFEDAAKAKDWTEEQEHCYTAMEEAPSWREYTSFQRRDWLMRERAAARAEVEAKYARLRTAGALINESRVISGPDGVSAEEWNDLSDALLALDELGK